MAQDVLYIESAEQAGVMLKPLRIELLRLMERPRTCPELAEVFGETPQKIYYHVKALEKARLVERCGERQVRGATEGFYRARAKSYGKITLYTTEPNFMKKIENQAVSCKVLLAHAHTRAQPRRRHENPGRNEPHHALSARRTDVGRRRSPCTQARGGDARPIAFAGS